jgi:hypothetical protein
MRPQDPGLCLVARLEPQWNEDQALGAVKLLDFIIDPNFRMKFRYFIKTTERCSKLRVHLPLANGQRLIYEIPSPPLNAWTEASADWAHLQSAGLAPSSAQRLQATAIALTADIPKADPDLPILLGLDDIEIRASRPMEFGFLEPEVVCLSEWKERIPLKHFQSGQQLTIRGKYPAQPEKVLLSICTLSDMNYGNTQDWNIRLKRAADGTWQTSVRLDSARFPPGLYLSKIRAEDRGVTVSETSLTIFIASPAPLPRPRILFDAAGHALFRSRLLSERFKSVLDRLLSRAKSYREQVQPENLVYDIDQFPTRDWVASLKAWYSDRFLAFREALFTNAIVHASGKEEEAGPFCVRLLLALARWPQWNHPWMEARGFHTYYPLGEFADAYAISYDLTYPLLSEAERNVIREGLVRNFIIPAYKTYIEDNQITSNSSNWLSHIAGGAIVALLAVSGDDPGLKDLEPWLTGFILKEAKYIDTVFGGDGSYGEGYRYYSFAMQSFAKAIPALRRLLNVDLSRPIANSHLETLWTSILPKNIAFTFGDTESYLKKEAQAWWIGSDTGPMNSWAWLLDLYHDPYLAHLYRSLKDFDTLQEVLFETEDIAPREPSLLGQVKFFRDVGTAVFKSGWKAEDFLFVFRSGPFLNHQHMDQGSFYLADHGEVFLEERYDGEHHYYDDPDYRSHAIQAISHNTILLDRNPQSQKVGDPAKFAAGLADQARFVRWLDSDFFAFASGDLTGVYSEKVKKLQRQVLYIKPRAVLLVDEIIPDKDNVEVNLLFHTKWKKDIVLEEKYAAFQKGQSALYLFPVFPSGVKREVLTEPHFLYQYEQMPLIERGYLRQSARTNGRRLIMANFLTATQDGRVPPVKLLEFAPSSPGSEVTGPLIQSSIDGIDATVLINVQGIISHGGFSSDALLLAHSAEKNIFMAEGTYLKKDGDLLLAFDKPTVAALDNHGKELIMNYHLNESARARIKVKSQPSSIQLKGQYLRSGHFNPEDSILELNLPAGVGTIRLLFK